ncbi:hypothetical protein [Bradyrhizobium sp.]|uniref:hypothetical protein n=1 Tax=Bradyrhizobium sp. TaxID=376 RepID=UPI003C49D618
MMFRVFLLVALLLIHAQLRAKPPAEEAGFAPNLVIYLAKGPANSCGTGCDHWIAVEGKVDRDAASRIRRFLQNMKDTRRPIYFHSPGGAVEQAFVIGRLLRNRKAIARIGRTIVAACGATPQADNACLKIKTAGGEVEAEIATSHAMCNSACGYLFLGATTREVAPDAVMAVHSSKFTMVFHGHPSEAEIAAFTRGGIARADRERAAFIAAMGISHELNDLIATVRFENPHVLTRSELYRFGIDTRTVAETAWTLQPAPRPYIRKLALAKRHDDASFRAMEWRLFCENKDRARLTFIREFDKGAAGLNAVIMMAGSEKPVSFEAFPARIGPFEAWSGTIASAAMTTLLAVPHVQVAEATLLPDGKTNQEILDIDTSGLESAWSRLLASCAAPNSVKPVIASPIIAWPPAR